jgi:hypothetical protein
MNCQKLNADLAEALNCGKQNFLIVSSHQQNLQNILCTSTEQSNHDVVFLNNQNIQLLTLPMPAHIKINLFSLVLIDPQLHIIFLFANVTLQILEPFRSFIY